MTRTLGVIGGMGPAATFDFCARLTAAWPGPRDQDHPRILVDSDPSIPDRNAALRGDGPSPGPHLASMARRLEAGGAELVVMPCNTAHAWKADITGALTVPFLDMIEATVAEVPPPVRRVGVLAVDGCRTAGLFQNALEGSGREALLLDPEPQRAFMDLIYAIKAGSRGDEPGGRMRALAGLLVAQGAEVLIAGCTEIPLVMQPDEAPAPLVVSTDALVRAVCARLAALPAGQANG